MKKLVQSSRFKKDLKRYQHKNKQKEHLETILDLLKEGKAIPAKYKPHLLKGEWEGYTECHVENDLLLIWIDPNTNEIILIRFGTHAELYGK